MRFNWGVIIANWKLYPIPRHDDLKYSRLWQFLTVSKETENSVKEQSNLTFWKLSSLFVPYPSVIMLHFLYCFYFRDKEIGSQQLALISILVKCKGNLGVVSVSFFLISCPCASLLDIANFQMLLIYLSWMLEIYFLKNHFLVVWRKPVFELFALSVCFFLLFSIFCSDLW